MSAEHNYPIEQLPPKEAALAKLAYWWKDRLICRKDEIETLSFFPDIVDSLRRFQLRPYYALVTHHCRNQQNKESIQELGGVIGVPHGYSLSYGAEASGQVLHSLDIQRGAIGKPRDGLTHVYLHPVPFEIHEACQAYFAHQSVFAVFADRSLPPKGQALGTIQGILEAPWAKLPYHLAEENGPNILRERLEKQGGWFEMIDMSQPDFTYKLRMLENQFLIAVI